MTPICLLAAVWLPAQCIEPLPQPPHQSLWTCSSRLRCHNEMTCHEIGEVSLPFLDCLGRICDCLCPRKRRHPIRFEGVDTRPMHWPGPGQPDCKSP